MGIPGSESDTMGGFEQRETLGSAYWDDPRWQEVLRLRARDNQADANNLVFKIRSDWGVD